MTIKDAVIDFKSLSLYLLRVVLHTSELDQLTTVLNERIINSGNLFKDEPIIIDTVAVKQPIDWNKLLDIFQKYKLVPIGVITNLMPTPILQT